MQQLTDKFGFNLLQHPWRCIRH